MTRSQLCLMHDSVTSPTHAGCLGCKLCKVLQFTLNNSLKRINGKGLQKVTKCKLLTINSLEVARVNCLMCLFNYFFLSSTKISDYL